MASDPTPPAAPRPCADLPQISFDYGGRDVWHTDCPGRHHAPPMKHLKGRLPIGDGVVLYEYECTVCGVRVFGGCDRAGHIVRRPVSPEAARCQQVASGRCNGECVTCAERDAEAAPPRATNAPPVDPPIPHCPYCGKLSSSVAGAYGEPRCDHRCRERQSLRCAALLYQQHKPVLKGEGSMSTATRRAKTKTPKPHALAFIAEVPCVNCGCEWFRPTVKFVGDEMEQGAACANPWCATIARLRLETVLLAKLAADTPQFDNPLHIYTAKTLRDHILAKIGAPG